MKQKMNDPALKQGLMAMARDTKDRKELAMIASAQKAIIGYYFDMMCAMTVRRIKKTEKLELPDQEPMRRAVTEINRICANQKKEYLFTGDIMDPKDLFIFASGIAMPADEQKEGKTTERSKFEKVKAMAE